MQKHEFIHHFLNIDYFTCNCRTNIQSKLKLGTKPVDNCPAEWVRGLWYGEKWAKLISRQTGWALSIINVSPMATVCNSTDRVQQRIRAEISIHSFWENMISQWYVYKHYKSVLSQNLLVTNYDVTLDYSNGLLSSCGKIPSYIKPSEN